MLILISILKMSFHVNWILMRALRTRFVIIIPIIQTAAKVVKCFTLW